MFNTKKAGSSESAFFSPLRTLDKLPEIEYTAELD